MEAQLRIPGETFSKRNKFFFGTLVYFVFSVIIYILCRLSTGFADFTAEYPGAWVRLVLAGFTSIFPFSIAEGFLILLIPVSIIFLFFAPDRAEGKRMTHNSYVMLGVLLLILSIFLSAFAPCYFRTPVEEEMSLDRENITKENLKQVIDIISEEISLLESTITTNHEGSSLMPLSYSELALKLNRAYDSLADKYDFLSEFYSYPKPLAISKLMPYTRISGFYTFFTGEANISTAYPDFMIPFTMAHEMAHQRGIAKEDEANFIAFLVCIESSDKYIKYSGYTELLNYLFDSLYKADASLFYDAYYSAPKIYKTEYAAYAKFFYNTTADAVSDVTGAVNNTLLQSQGQSAGSESYNLVTELATAYYMKKQNPKN